MTEFSPEARPDVWREGRLLVLVRGAALPPNCIKCAGEATGKPIKVALRWRSLGNHLLAIFSPLLNHLHVPHYLATVRVGLCREHRRRRWLGAIGGILIVLGGITLMILPMVANRFIPLFLPGIAVLLAGWFVLDACWSPVGSAQMDDHLVWLKRAGVAYLDRLPERPDNARRV